MKKEYLISLIEKMSSNNIQNIDEILLKDEQILYLLYNLEEDFFRYGINIVNAGYKSNSDIIKAIKILENTTVNNIIMTVNILTNKFLIKDNLSLFYAKMIIKYKDSPCLVYLYQYMINDNLMTKDINTKMKDLKLLTECRGELNAKYVYKVLKNENEKIQKNAYDIINILKNVEHIPSLEAMYDIICDEIALENDTILDGIKFINTIRSNRYISELSAAVFTEYNLIKSGFYKDAAKLISEFDNDDLAELAFNIMIAENVINGNVVIESGNFIKKLDNDKYSGYIYTVLTDKKLIEEGLSLKVAEFVRNSNEHINAEYIEKFSTCHNIDPLIIIEGCELINSIKNNNTLRYVFYALTNKYLNECDKKLECAYIISKYKSKQKHLFINYFILSKKEVACNKNITQIIEDIYKSNILFNEFKINLEGIQNKIIEFGVVLINYNHNIEISDLIGLFSIMEKLSLEEIEIIKNKYRGFGVNNLLFRHKFNKIFNKSNTSSDIIELIKNITGTHAFDKKIKHNILVEEPKSISTLNNNDTNILLDILSNETDEEIKTDVLVKKLVKIRDNNTVNE